MNKKKIINYLQLMQRVFFVYRIALVLLILAALFMPLLMICGSLPIELSRTYTPRLPVYPQCSPD